MMRYRVLCADPPWAFSDRLGKRGAGHNYATLSVHQVCAFEIPRMLPNAWLFLWRVASQVEEAYQVCRAWGFTPKTEIIWRKLTKTGRPHFGMGHYVRASHEVCIVATRGRVRPAVRNVRSVIEAPVGRHSEKPEIFYDLVETLTGGGPYVELFARRVRLGWTCLGNEVPR